MFSTETLGILWKVTAAAIVAAGCYWLITCIQHAHIADMYKVAGAF